MEKILREAAEGTKIYVPIRNAPGMSFEDRFWKKVHALIDVKQADATQSQLALSQRQFCDASASAEQTRGCGLAGRPCVLSMPTACIPLQMLPRDFFNVLREEWRDDFDDFIRAHLIPIHGDVDQPLLGFPPDVVSKLQDEVSLQ